MALLLLCAVAVQSQSAPPLLTVDIGGRQVAVSFPSTHALSDTGPTVEIAGYKYLVDFAGNLGTRFTGDGGWAEVSKLYPAIAQKSASAPEYRIKVILFKMGELLEEGGDSVWRRHRGAMGSEDLNKIFAELATFKAVAETACNGAVRVTFDVTEDDDLQFRCVRVGGSEPYTNDNLATQLQPGSRYAGDHILGPGYVQEEVAPYVNNDKFESQDGRYRGPYGSVFVIHAVPTSDLTTYLLDRTPVTTMSWPTIKPSNKLALQLFATWQQHLVVSAEASGRDVGASKLLAQTQWLKDFPDLGELPISDELIASANHFLTQFDNGRTSVGRHMDLERTRSGPVSEGRIARTTSGHVLVDPFLVDAFTAAHPDAKPLGRKYGVRLGWDAVLFDLPGASFKNDLEALSISGVTTPIDNGESGGGSAAHEVAPEQTDPTTEWLSELKGPLSTEDVAKIRMILAGNDVDLRINALGALDRIETEEFVTDLGVAAVGPEPAEAYLAIEVLKKRKDDRAWAQIASAAIRGPFGPNFAFAAAALEGRPEEVTIDLLSSAMYDRSRHARLAAARTLNAIDTNRAHVLAATMLDDPDPRVRYAIAQGSRPDNALFARRLLYSAVNDESEWVRAQCSISLLDNKDENMRKQAMNAVRDESDTVKLAMLAEMTRRPNAEHRPALRIAVVDTCAAVRAAALRAFAAQPGEVLSEEVQNTFNDPSPHVRSALEELARAKNIKLP